MKRFFIWSGIVLIIGILGLGFWYRLENKAKNQPNIAYFKSLPLQEQVRYLDQLGKTTDVLKILDFIQQAYPDEPNDKHDLSHKLGELAVNQYGIAGFGDCNSLLQYGCFHGAALAAVRLEGDDDPNLAKDLWEGCKSRAKDPGSCLHGLGHAVIMIKQYDLPAAYVECDKLLDSPQYRFWCYDGVSMENITRSMASVTLGSYGNPGNIYYPCDSIPEQYETACVRNHVGYLYRNWGEDFQRAVNYCKTFNGTTAQECVHILGSIEPDLFERCNIAGTYRKYCIEGAATSYSMSKQFDRAGQICDTLEESDKYSCMKKIESFLQVQ